MARVLILALSACGWVIEKKQKNKTSYRTYVQCKEAQEIRFIYSRIIKLKQARAKVRPPGANGGLQSAAKYM